MMNRKACSVQTASVGISLRMLFRWLKESRRRLEPVSSWVSYLAASGQDVEFSHASSLSHFHFIACPPRFPPQPPIRPLYMSMFTNKGDRVKTLKRGERRSSINVKLLFICTHICQLTFPEPKNTISINWTELLHIFWNISLFSYLNSRSCSMPHEHFL